MELNGHGLGRLLRDSTRRVVHLAAGKKRFQLEFQSKDTEGKEEDWFSDLDTAAQGVYLRLVDDSLPGAGFIGEEGKVRRPPGSVKGLTIVADGIDGTKALKRQQSTGIGTMVAAVQDDIIIGAYVGDICTGEIYGYHPDSTRVSRIVESMHGIEMKIDAERPLQDQYVLLRDHWADHSGTINRIVARSRGSGRGLFKNVQIGGGSIGITMSQLWKGEVGGVILRPHHINPWDWCPSMGITQRMGFGFFYYHVDDRILREFVHSSVLEEGECPHELIIVHQSRRDELARWLDRYQA